MSARRLQSYSIKQVAEILGYSTNSIYSFVKTGAIKAIRLGHGKFKIPQSEIDRFLATPDNPITDVVTEIASRPQEHSPVVETPIQEIIEQGRGINGFFLLAGVVGLITGIVMILFSSAWSEVWVISGWQLVTTIGIGFGLSGCGMLYGVQSDDRRTIRAVSTVLGIVSYLAITLIMTMHGDVTGAALFGGWAVALSASLFPFISAIVLSVTAVILPVILYAAASGMAINTAYRLSGTSTVAMIVILAAIIGGGSLLFGWTAKKQGITMIGMSILTILFLAGAYDAGTSFYWVRAWMLMVTGIMIPILALWEPWNMRERFDKAVLFLTTCTVVILLIGTVSIVRVLERTMMNAAVTALSDKVAYAKLATTTSVETAKTGVSGIVGHQEFVDAVKTKKTDVLLNLCRGLFEGNRLFSSLYVIGTDGTPVMTYPLGRDVTPADRYLLEGVYATSLQNGVAVSEIRWVEKRPYIFIASSKKEKIGTAGVVAVMNLDALGTRLQELAESDRGEYVTVTDTQGRTIAGPLSMNSMDAALASTTNGTMDMQQVTTMRMPDGAVYVKAEATVPGFGWIVAVISPVTSMLHMQTVLGMIGSMLGFASVLVIGVSIAIHSIRRPFDTGGGSP